MAARKKNPWDQYRDGESTRDTTLGFHWSSDFRKGVWTGSVWIVQSEITSDKEEDRIVGDVFDLWMHNPWKTGRSEGGFCSFIFGHSLSLKETMASLFVEFSFDTGYYGDISPGDTEGYKPAVYNGESTDLFTGLSLPTYETRTGYEASYKTREYAQAIAHVVILQAYVLERQSGLDDVLRVMKMVTGSLRRLHLSSTDILENTIENLDAMSGPSEMLEYLLNTRNELANGVFVNATDTNNDRVIDAMKAYFFKRLHFTPYRFLVSEAEVVLYIAIDDLFHALDDKEPEKRRKAYLYRAMSLSTLAFSMVENISIEEATVRCVGWRGQ